MAIFVVRGNTLSLPPAHAATTLTGSISIQVQASGAFTWNQAAFQARIDPTITTGPLVGIPIFDIPEGQAGFEVDIGALVSGNPAKVVMVHDPAREYNLAGVTWDATAKKFKYDGSPGLGAVKTFRAWATAGESFVPETDPVPYSALRPISTTWCGPMWRSKSIQYDGSSSFVNYLITHHTALHNTNFMYCENTGGDWYGLGETLQGTTPYDQFTLPAIGQTVNRDVTAVWKKFESGYLPNFGFWFTAATNAFGGFWGKTDTSGRGPVLTITWADDTTSTLQAACSNDIASNRDGVNAPLVFQAGADIRGLVYFDPTGLSQSRRVKTVMLNMTVAQFYTAGLINMFVVRWQGQDDVTTDPYTGGISDDYDADVGLENHPSVLTVARFPTSSMIVGANFFPYLTSEQSLRGWHYIGNQETGTDPLTNQNAVVLGSNNSDPGMSGFVPLRPGINAYRRFIRANTTPGGYGPTFEVYSRCGFKLDNQRQALDAPVDTVNFPLDAQELWTRCYVRLARSPGGGHHAPGMMGRYEGPQLGSDSRTGRPWNSPMRANPPVPVDDIKWYWQLEPLGVQSGDLVEGVYDWHGNPYIGNDPTLALPTRYRPTGSYSYFPQQTGQTTPEWQMLLHFHRKLRGMLEEDRWYCMEHHCKMNTFTGGVTNNNASAEIYINGRFVCSRESYGPFSIAKIEGAGITAAFFESFSPGWPPASGGSGASPYDCMTYHSQMVVATQRIGIGKF